MASSLASLVVSLEANVAKFTTDMNLAARTTTQAMGAITAGVENAKKQFLDFAASVVSVGAAVKAVKDAISLGDELKQVSDATGIAVEKLDQLAIVAKLNGAGLGDIANATKFVTKSMIEAQDETSKTGQLFAALGVATKDANGNLRSTFDVMSDTAKALNAIDNETTRSAVGIAIFGKGYLAIAASLRNFAEDQRRANEVLTQYGSVSTLAANLSDELHDKLTLLGEGSKRALLNNLLPGIAGVLAGIEELNKSGGRLQQGFGQVVSIVLTSVVHLLIELKTEFEVVGTVIAAVIASITTRSTEHLKALGGDIKKILSDAEAAHARVTAAAESGGKLDADDERAIARAKAAQDRANAAAINARRLNAILSQGAEKFDVVAATISRISEQYALQKQAGASAVNAAKETQETIIAIENQGYQTRQISELAFLQTKQNADRAASQAAIQAAEDEVNAAKTRLAALYALQSTPQTRQQEEATNKAIAAGILDLTKAQENLARARHAGNIQEINDATAVLVAIQAINDAVVKQKEAWDDFTQSLQLQSKEEQYQLSLLGKTRDEVELLNAAHQVELQIQNKQIELQHQLRDEQDRGASANQKRIDEIQKELEQLPQLGAARVAAATKAKAAELEYQNSFAGGWQKAFQSYIDSISAASIAQQSFNTLTQSMEQLFVDFANNATNAFKRFTDSILQMITQIAARLAVSGVFQLLGLGNIGAGGIGGTAGGGGGLNLSSLLNLGSSAGSAFSGGGNPLLNFITSSLGYGAPVTATAGETAGIAAGTIAPALEVSALTAGTAGSAFAPLLAAAPWAAIAAIAVPFVISAFKKGGGPQTREFGTSGADIGTFGDFAATHKLIGTDAVQSAALVQAAQTEKGTYDGVVRALGATPGQAQFALYTSQDIKGTASNQLDVRSTVGGQAAYTANIQDVLGRKPEELAAALKLEAQRAVLGALQATDLPKYLHDLFSSVTAASATEEQIQNIIAVGTAIKQVADAIPSLGEAFTKLDPSSIKGLVDAVGGVEAFTNSMKFLADNFSTSSDKLDQAKNTLTEGFAALNLQVPETHQAFLDLLKSFDLTTESGRRAYAAVLSLSGSFVAVKGTADDAAKAVLAQAEANRQAIGSLRDAQLGFAQSTATSPLAQAQLQLAHDQQETNDLIQQFIADKPWAQQFVAGGGNLAGLLVHIAPEDFVQYSESDQKVILALINHAASINKDSQTIADASNNVASSFNDWQASLERAQEDAAALQNATQQGQQFANNFIQQAQQFAGQQPGADFGQKLTLEMQYIATQLAALRANPAQFGFQSRLSADYRAAISTLQSTDAALLASLNLFNQLKVRYGASIAEQLVNITDTYKQQAAALTGNAAGLALLNQTFEDQWNAIINGTAAGVSGVQDELTKLRQNILDYVDSLKIGNLSPLTPSQKLAEAQQQYQTTLTSAQAGDQTALQNITTNAGNLLDLARDFYASSPAYTNLFNQITSELTALGTVDLGAVSPPMNEADQALLNALPTASKLMSAADMQAVVDYLQGIGVTNPTLTLPVAPISTPTANSSAIATITPTTQTSTPATTAPDTSVVDATVQQTAAITSTQQTTANQIIAAVNASGSSIIEALTVGQK